MSRNLAQPLISTKQLALSRLVPWLVFVTGVLYYCYAYLLRVYPSVMETQLLAHFHVGIKDFGWLTGLYYVAYAPMQIPVGVTVDRIGARRSLLLGCLFACIGVFIFAHTSIFAVALIGRFCIGVGAAFGYVTALKIATIWLPRRYFATATGFVTGAGMIAAIFTDNYLTRLVQTHPLSQALLFPSLIGVGLFALIFLLVKNKNTMQENEAPIESDEVQAQSFKELFSQLKKILKMQQMWLIGIIGAFLYLPSSVLVDAWAIPYLKSAKHFSPDAAAFGVSLTLGGWIISSFLTGYLSDRFKSRKIPLQLATVGAAIFSSMIFFVPSYNHAFIYTSLFLLGCFCGPHPLCFSLSKESCPHNISGTAVSFANFIIMIGGMILQPGIGLLLSYIKTHQAYFTSLTLSPNWDFSLALSIIPIGLVLAFFMTIFLKETYHNTH